MLCLSLAACAGKKDDAWQHDKQAVVNSIVQAGKERQKMTAELSRQQQRLLKLENQMKKQDASLEAIQASLEAIHTRIQQVASGSKPSSDHSSSGSAGASKRASHQDAERALEKKLDKVEKSISEVKSPASESAPKLTSEDEKNRYTAAYLALKSGRYDEASSAFEKLVKDFPDGELTDQAYYWLGESYYAQHKLKPAIRAFEKVAKTYPHSPKHAAAMLRLGTTYQESGNSTRANAIFQKLIREHPDSAAAENARSLIKAAQRGKKPSR
ncbi:MAG TPA: tol-pal system protein YbgF [Mariprofundaceae bacterium]|nr:tol-pal system protein YbgF [Mariprofundaceae bacterium]